MQIRRIFIFLTGFLLLRSVCPSAQTNIAVLELSPKGLSETEASILSDRLRAELFKQGGFKVIEREMMDQILQEQGFQQTGCTTDECIVQVGRLIGVEQMVGGSVSKFGNMYSISTRIVGVETGEILHIATFDHDGELEGLLRYGMADVAVQLTGKRPAPQPERRPEISTVSEAPAGSYGQPPGSVYAGVEVFGKGLISGLNLDVAVMERMNCGAVVGFYPDTPDIFFTYSFYVSFLFTRKKQVYFEPCYMISSKGQREPFPIFMVGIGYHYLNKKKSVRFKIGPYIFVNEVGVFPWAGLSYTFRL